VVQVCGEYPAFRQARGAYPEQVKKAGGVRGVHDVLLGLLVVMTGLAAVSAVVLVTSVKEEDSGSAWMWTAVFVVASIIDALSFWSLW
jgi:hypothetical protein